MNRKYGWIPDRPSDKPWFDHEKLLRISPKTPDVTAWRKYVKWVSDQLQEGSCTAFSYVGANRFFRSIMGLADLDASQQFLYYCTRSLEGSTKYDSGASIADTEKAATTFGVCEQQLWPYSKPLTTKPSTAAYKNALDHQILVKAPVQQTQQALEACIAAGQPIHYGMSVYPSFESSAVAKSGVVPMPGKREQSLGGHALYLFDYNRPRRRFYGQNSWGSKWGQDSKSIFEIPYDYILDPDYASDFWTISKIEA